MFFRNFMNHQRILQLIVQASMFELFSCRLCFATVHKRSISPEAINFRFVSGLVEFIGDADEARPEF